MALLSERIGSLTQRLKPESVSEQHWLCRRRDAFSL
jgi:hypothetical protein